MNFKVVIPAHFESTRFPGKLLATIRGQTVIDRVINIAKKSGATDIIVATDDQRIAQSIESSDCEVIMTSKDHQSGTARIAEVVAKKNWASEEVIINLQGDEPFIPAELVTTVAETLASTSDASIATACFPIARRADVFDPNLVKVVLDHHNYALYFSRAPIPWARDTFSDEQESLPDDYIALGHIGLYGYRSKFLLEYSKLPSSFLENQEKLEQLRVLQAGHKIITARTHAPPAPGIDTPEDLERARQFVSTL
ncbi:MAG: 3-deoxy-manno-octulosonate cytidylyltransferase [Burkholderiales bacterium]|nr:3-deoxy-manno-octulosonate cytidylyltransferase [Burkholderiales bacterium]